MKLLFAVKTTCDLDKIVIRDVVYKLVILMFRFITTDEFQSPASSVIVGRSIRSMRIDSHTLVSDE